MAVDRIQSVLFQALKEKGWLIAGKDNSILIKNDYLFVYHKGNTDNKEPIRSFAYNGELIANNRPVILNPANCSWHIERYGWLLDKGQIASVISDLYEGDNTDKIAATEALTDLVTRIDTISEKSDIAIKSIKQRLTKVQKKEVQRNIVESDKNIDKGVYFKTLNVPLPCGLEYGKVYYVEDYDSNGFYITTLNKNLSGVRKNGDIIVPVDAFLLMVKNKYLIACELQEDFGYTEELEWVGLNSGSDTDFPEELKVFNIPKEKQAIIAEAFYNHLNITPFLNPLLTKASLEILLDAGKRGIPVGIFNNVDMDVEAIKEVISLVEQGYSVNSLLNKGYTAEYIKAIFNESYSDLQEKEKELRTKGFNDKQIKVLVRMYFDGIDTAPYENINYSDQIMQLLNYASDNEDLHSLADLFCNRAFNGEKLYVPGDFLSGQEKANIRNIFYVENGLSIRDKEWNDFIEGILDNLKFIYFTPEQGFLFRTNNLGLGIEHNSFYITELTDTPKWRASYINEKFYVSKSLEEHLYY